MANRANIKSETVSVFIAPAGTTSWTEVGFCESGKTRLFSDARSEIALNGRSYVNGKRFNFESVALETNDSKIVAIEAYENTLVDIRLVSKVDALKSSILKNFRFAMSLAAGYTQKDVQRLSLKASRYAKRYTDFLEVKQIVVLESWGII